MFRPPATPDEDELDELPPLDGETGDSAESDEPIEELDDDGTEATLDDSTGEDESPDVRELALVGDDEKSWLDEPADAQDLDLGDIALIILRDEGSSLDEPDESALGDEDVGLLDTSQRAGLDTGDEGPLDADEELRDEDLPALDADEEGEPADAGFIDDRFAADEPLGLPWAADPWARVGAPLGLVRATAIACAGRGALVSAVVEAAAEPGEDRIQLVQVDLEGARQPIAAEGLDDRDVQSLSVGGIAGNLVAVVLRGGRVALSRDGGAHFEASGPATAVAEAAIAGETVWFRTRGGGLFALRDGERAPGLCVLSASVAAVAASGAVIVGLVVDPDRRPTAIASGDAEGYSEGQSEGYGEGRGEGSSEGQNEGCMVREPIDAPEVRASALLAVRGPHLAYAGRSGVVRRGPDGLWQSFVWQGRVTALTFVDDDGTLVIATYADADDTTGLVRLDSKGNATIVARTGALRSGGRSDGRVLGMACDDAHGVLWVAGGFGIAAFAITGQRNHRPSLA